MSYIDYDLAVKMIDNLEITTSMVQTIEEISQDDGHDQDDSDNLLVSESFQPSVRARGKKIWKNSCIRKTELQARLILVPAHSQTRAGQNSADKCAPPRTRKPYARTVKIARSQKRVLQYRA
jgi:hypothetical protein